MSISERKDREKKEKKELILAAALRMFIEEGYAKTSIRKIAHAIDYSTGTIYLYYKDKDEILYEVQAFCYGKLFEAFRKKANNKEPLKRLHQLCETYIDFGLANPEFYDLMFIIRAPTNVDEKEHKENGLDCLNYLSDCLRTCIEQGLLLIKELDFAVLQVWSTVHGLVSLYLRCRLKIMIPDDENVNDVLVKTMENYLRTITA